MQDTPSGTGKPSGRNRKALIESLRADHRAASRKAGSETSPPSSAPRAPARIMAYDFSQLAEFRQLQMHRAAADMIGLENPFFRVHDGAGGPTSEIGGKVYDNFSSYNYLGLNMHPRVRAAASAALEHYGTSATASRVVAGERAIHRDLERALAELHGTEDSVVMVSGHATNVTVIGHLLGEDDLILTDTLIHNSISEGARLSGARKLTFPHGDLDALEDLLSTHRHAHRHVLIVVEGIYSMDGDYPDLPRLLALKAAHDCWLMVDEAHSIGVMGQAGRGIGEHFGIDAKGVEMWMGTLSKTMASCGGYIAGSKTLCDYLRATAPGFVFSVGLSPVLAASALESCRILLAGDCDRVARLQENGRTFRDSAQAIGLDTGASAGLSVVPVIVGDSVRAVTLSNRLHDRGILALPIIYPAVGEKSARLRFFLTSEHSPEQIERAVTATAEEFAALKSGSGGFRALLDSVSQAPPKKG